MSLCYAVRLSRKGSLKILVGVLTGHNTLNQHLTLLKIKEDPMYPLCGRCSALVGKRRKQEVKNALGEMQTLRAGRSNAKPFSPRRRPPSRGRGTAKILSAGDGHYLHLQTQFGENRCTRFRVIMVTDPHTNNARPLQTHRHDR